MVASKWGIKHSSCLNCGTIERKHSAKGLCSKCYPNLKLRNNCSICNKFNITSRREGDKVICVTCNKKYFTPIKKKQCSICNRIKTIHKNDNNKLICSSCYNKYYYVRNKKECYGCKEIIVIRGYKENKAYCNSCYYYKFYTKPKFLCEICNKLAHTSAIIQNKRYCHKCYKKLNEEHFIALKLWCRNKESKKLTDQDIREIGNRDKNCVYCNDKENLTFDHIIPVSKGGKSELNNLVLACRNCNLSKNKSDVFQWCKRRGIEVPNIIFKLLRKNGEAAGAYGAIHK